MRFLIIFLLLISDVFAANPGAIFGGDDILMLKPSIRFKDSETRITSNVVVDPQVVPTAGDPGDILILSPGLGGTWYRKTDVGTSTNWSIMLDGGTNLLKDWTTNTDYIVDEIAVVGNNIISRALTDHTSDATDWANDFLAGNTELVSIPPLSNGVRTVPTFTLDTINDEIDVGAGDGVIMTYGNLLIPTVEIVIWAAQSCVNPDPGEWVTAYIDNTGTLQCELGVPTSTRRASDIVVGTAFADLNEIFLAGNYPTNPANQTTDFIQFTGAAINEGAFSPNGLNLTFNRGAGSTQFIGAGAGSIIRPNVDDFVAQVPVANFFQATGIDIDTVGIAVLNTTDYDPNGLGVVTAITNNRWVGQRLYVTLGGKVITQYAQEQYLTHDEAVSAVTTDSNIIVVPDGIVENAIWTGAIVYTTGETSLDGNGVAQVTFINCDKQGCGSGGGSSGGAGGGDFFGPAASTDDGIVRFDGTTGKIGDDSNVTISDAGIMNFNGDVLQIDPNITDATIAALNLGPTNTLFEIQDEGAPFFLIGTKTNMDARPVTNANEVGITVGDVYTGAFITQNWAAWMNRNAGALGTEYALLQNDGGDTIVNAGTGDSVLISTGNDGTRAMVIDGANIFLNPDQAGGFITFQGDTNELNWPDETQTKIDMWNSQYTIGISSNQMNFHATTAADFAWWAGGENGDLNGTERLRLDNNTGDLIINAAYALPNADGNANEVLTTDGAGNADWVANGLGDVVGPGVAVQDRGLAVWDGTTGELIREPFIGNGSGSRGALPTLLMTANGSLATGPFENNGGATPAAEETAIHFLRPGVTGVASHNLMEARISRYVDIGTEPRTRINWYINDSGNPTVARLPMMRWDVLGFGFGDVDVDGYTFPFTRGTDGQVLQTDATGGVTWQDVADVSGPGAAVIGDAIAIWDGTTGDLIKQSPNTDGSGAFGTTPTIAMGAAGNLVTGTELNNGGNTPVVEEDVFTMFRSGVNTESFPNIVTGRISRYENTDNANPRTRVTWYINHTRTQPEADNATLPIMTWDDLGIGIGDVASGTPDGYRLPYTDGIAGQGLTTDGAGTMSFTTVGDVSGPATSVDNAIPRWDGVGGDTLQDSGVTLADDDTIGFPAANEVKIEYFGNTWGVGVSPNRLNWFIPNTIDYVWRSDGFNETGTERLRLDAATGGLTINQAFTLPVADGTADQVLTTDGAGQVTWETVATGGAGVAGPGASTDNALARWDGTGGDVIQNSNATLTNDGTLTLQGNISVGEDGAFLGNIGFSDLDTNVFTISAPLDIDTNYTITMPRQGAVEGQYLVEGAFAELEWRDAPTQKTLGCRLDDQGAVTGTLCDSWVDTTNLVAGRVTVNMTAGTWTEVPSCTCAITDTTSTTAECVYRFETANQFEVWTGGFFINIACTGI